MMDGTARIEDRGSEVAEVTVGFWEVGEDTLACRVSGVRAAVIGSMTWCVGLGVSAFRLHRLRWRTVFLSDGFLCEGF